MKQNVGTINALIRITAGFTILSWIIPKMVWRPYRESNLWIAMMAGMKIAEGITRFCPVTYMYEQYQKNQTCQPQSTKTKTDDEQEEVVNPS